jgi:hypothetical protein
MKRVLFLSICFTLLAMLAVTGTALAQDERTSEFYIVSDIDSASCTGLHLRTFRHVEADRHLTILVFHDGHTVQDYAGPLGPASGTSGISLIYQDVRGLAPVNYFPLNPAKPISVMIGIWTADWQPIYEWRAIIPSCNSTLMTDVTHGPAYTLTYNHSFEAPGLMAPGVVDNTKAAFWNGKNTFNDIRVCNAPRGGTSAYVGLCGMYMQSDVAAKSKFVNKYSGTVGKAGDLLLLNFYAQTLAGYNGGGKVIGKAVLADGSVIKVTVPTPAYPVGYSGYPYYQYGALTAPIVSAKTMIKQSYGLGVITLDAVTFSVMTSANDVPRALPVPDSLPVETLDNP